MSARTEPARPGKNSLEDVLKIGYALNGVSIGARNKSVPQKGLRERGEKTLKRLIPDEDEDEQPRKKLYVRVANAVDPFTPEVADALFEFYMEALLKEDISEAQVMKTLRDLEGMCKVSKLVHNRCKTATRWTAVMNKKEREYNNWGPATYHNGDPVDFKTFCHFTAFRMVGQDLYESWGPVMIRGKDEVGFRSRLLYMAAIFGMKHNLKKIHVKNEGEAWRLIGGGTLKDPVLERGVYKFVYQFHEGMNIIPPGMDLSNHRDEIEASARMMQAKIDQEVRTFLTFFFRKFAEDKNQKPELEQRFVKQAYRVASGNMADMLWIQMIYTSFHDTTAPLALLETGTSNANSWTEKGNLRSKLLAQKDEYDAYAQEICLHVMRLQLIMGLVLDAHEVKVDTRSLIDAYLTRLTLSDLDMNIDYEDFSFNLLDHYDGITNLVRASRFDDGYHGMKKSYVNASYPGKKAEYDTFWAA